MKRNKSREILIESTCSDCGEKRYLQNRPENIARTRCASCAAIGRGFEHGLTQSPIYKVWSAMKQRCINSSDEAYPIYGGRGITVCSEWIESFPPFFTWAMTNGYAKGLQIDREDNDGNYEPSNCRWVVPTVNARNRSTTKLTVADVQEAKYMLSCGYQSNEVADLLEVSKSCIWGIKAGHTWGNVTVGTWTGATASA